MSQRVDTASWNSAASIPHLMKPPRVPGARPGIGHLLRFAKNPVALAHDAYASCGEVAEIKLPGKSAFLFTGPDAHEFVLTAPATDLSMAEFFKFILPAFYGAGYRYDAAVGFPFSYPKLFLPLMTEAKMRSYARIVQEESAALLEGGARELDLFETGKKLFLRTATRSLLGSAVGEDQLREFSGYYSQMQSALTLPAILMARAGLSALSPAEKPRRRMVALLGAIIRERRDHLAGTPDGVLDVLIQAKLPGDRALTDVEIAGMSMQLLFAAHTPASVAFAWTGIELARHPESVARIRQDLLSVPDLGAASLTDFRKLAFLDWCVQETLRLHCPAALHVRAVLQDVRYKDYLIPKGSLALIAPDVAHRITRYFPDPDRFDPTRFSPERTERKAHPMALMTFGGGPNRCIGSAFAMLQLGLSWANVLGRFDVEILDEVEETFSGLMMTPSSPCRARLTKRRN